MFELFFLHFLNDGIRTSFISLLPFISKELHLSFIEVGLIGASQGLLSTILSIPAGFLAARIGGIKLLLLSIVIYSLGAVGISLTHDFFSLILLFYFGASGFGMFHSVGWAQIAKLSSGKKVGRNMGNFTAFGDIGRITIPTASIFLAFYIGWHFMYAILGIIGLFFFTLFRFKVFLPNNASIKLLNINSKLNIKDWFREIFHLLKQKNLRLILISGGLDNLAGNSIYIFLPFLLLHRGITPAFLGIFIGVFLLGSLIGKSLLGRGADKFGNIAVLIFAEFMMACFLIILSFSNQLIVFFIASLMLGFFTRGTNPVISALFSGVTKQKHYEKVFGVSETFLSITSAIGPVTLGVFADKLGITSVFQVSALFAILALFPIVFLRYYAS